MITTPVDEAGLKAEIEPDEPEDVGKEPPKLKLNIKKCCKPNTTKKFQISGKAEQPVD